MGRFFCHIWAKLAKLRIKKIPQLHHCDPVFFISSLEEEVFVSVYGMNNNLVFTFWSVGPTYFDKWRASLIKGGKMEIRES